MPRPKSLKVPPYQLHDLIRKLKKKENDEGSAVIAIEGKSIISHLTEISMFDTAPATIEIDVKIDILKTDGQNDPDPSTLDNGEKMSSFGFTDMQYISLTKKFLKTAQKRKPSAKINLKDVKACEKVKDCVDLVTRACA